MSTSELLNHYTELYAKALRRLRENNYDIDKRIGDPADKRTGLSLIIRPAEDVLNSTSPFFNDLKAIEPAQYFYHKEQLHITVLAIIACYQEFTLDKVDLKEYIEIINDSLQGIKPFDILVKGVTASPSAIMLQGFPEGDTLNIMRDSLRIKFKNSGLQQSIDKRYAITTAHLTAIRYKEQLIDAERFGSMLENYRKYDFGTFTVSSLDLVCNDWYHQQQFVTHLHTFML